MSRIHVVFDCDGTLVDTTTPKYTLFPGIKEFIEEHEKEFNFYVWTARGRASTLRILQENGLASFFQGVFGVDDGFPKPHVGGLRDLVGTYPKHSICVIGDSGNDMAGAKNFGVMSIGAVWNGQGGEDYLRAAGADFIVSHPSECSKLIRLKLKGDSDV